MSFGEELRRERELREITLSEIARATKIDIRRLEALESNDFSVLPEGLYRRGYIRAYCQHIGVDAESMVNAYLLEERNQSDAEEGLDADGELLRGKGIFRAQDEENEAEVRMQAELLRRRRRALALKAALIAVLLVLVGVVGYRWVWPTFVSQTEVSSPQATTHGVTDE